MNTDIVNLVSDVKRLIEEYGVENVNAAIGFLASLNSQVQYINVYDASHTKIGVITHAQHVHMRALWNSGDKIACIKYLRSILYCGLKEAKQGVEILYESAEDRERRLNQQY